ncbi:MAG: GNAT family N-acetyltransferase [Deltaproteobacteria bacterium]|nr:MAG: GNAT family N-acetyltransferase [Deltaproteobacteria bacterium]
MAFTIAPVQRNELKPFMDYIRDHMSDNGHGVTPLFQPQSRQDPWDDSKLRIMMGTGLSIEVGQKGWRVLWVAKSDDGEIVGHVDLRGQSEPYTEHRALLGIGVHREYRQQGLGGKLLATAIAWAETQDTLDWIELRFLNTNPAAGRLYQKYGFTLLCTIEDTFRIDGESIGNNIMVKKL